MIKVTPRITVSGLMRRQALYHSIECRGILVNEERLAECRAYVDSEINKQLQIASKAWGKVLYVGVDNAPSYKLKEAIATGAISAEDAQLAIDNSFNIRSPEKFLAFLKDYGYKVPKATKKTVDGEWESKEGTSELILREMIMTNQFGSVNGDEALIAVLNVRELITLRSRYINARLFPRPEGPVYLSLYNAGSGTLTGRRNSKKHLYGYGGNAQNFAKHTETASRYRRCLVARPGFILLSVDQISAEDWPVCALAHNDEGLRELREGVDRHAKLGAAIFAVPVEKILAAKAAGEDPIERYLGKKTRHASNYDMKAPRMHDALMQEGKFFPIKVCESLLERAHAANPSVRGVFHKYIIDQINKNKTLITPYKRERQFLEFRPGSKNGNLWNEAYAYIPQSLVGDNTGFAVEELQLNPERNMHILQEGHDSVVQEVLCQDSPNCADVNRLCLAVERSVEAFDREVEFYNGIRINIPIEAELAWDFNKSVKIKELTRKGIEDALQKIGQRT